LKNPKEVLKVVVEFDEYGLPKLPGDGEYPEWVAYAIQEWRTSLISEKKALGLSIPE